MLLRPLGVSTILRLLVWAARVGKRDANTLATRTIVRQQDQPGYIHNCAVNCFYRGRTCLRLVLM